jgi:hypothetical protein
LLGFFFLDFGFTGAPSHAVMGGNEVPSGTIDIGSKVTPLSKEVSGLITERIPILQFLPMVMKDIAKTPRSIECAATIVSCNIFFQFCEQKGKKRHE